MAMRILWIEDEAEAELADYAGPVLLAGHQLDIATTATEAVELLRTREYDVVIIDLIINAGSGNEWKRLDTTRKSGEPYSYLGLELMRALFLPDRAAIALELPKGRLSPEKVAVFTVVADPEVHMEIRSMGITDIRVKPQSGLTVLKDIVESKVG